MDTLFIRELRIDTEIGVYEWEKNIKQPISIDLEVNTDVDTAASRDDLHDALDYQSIADAITQFASGRHFNLVETVAAGIADLILENFPVTWLKLRVAKIGAIRTATEVGVVIERRSEHG